MTAIGSPSTDNDSFEREEFQQVQQGQRKHINRATYDAYNRHRIFIPNDLILCGLGHQAGRIEHPFERRYSQQRVSRRGAKRLRWYK